MTNAAHLQVKNLTVYYDKNPALKNITINIPDKKITAIIGPSGCGKTTLLRSFNRLIDETENTTVSGTVIVDNEDIFQSGIDITRIRKKMGLLSQRPCPLPMSIFDNVAFGPRIHGMKNEKKLKEMVEYYLKESSLWNDVKDRLHTSASKLSIGQQQRLCLARCLAVEPEIILGDEPTSALDPISSTRIENKFKALKNNYTIVVVTHILRQARRLADYIIFLYCGELIEYGPAQQIFENPVMEKTKEYINGIIS